jgi:predicted permease
VVVAVLSLSLGSGLVSAAATLVNGMWYAPLPWAAADRMVDLGDAHPTEVPATDTPGTSVRSFEQWRTDLPAGMFERLEAGQRAWVGIRTGSGSSSTVRATRVSGGYAELLEFEARMGRLLSASDVAPGADPVAVVSHDLWRAAWGESADVLGRTLEIDGVGHTVIGVLRADVRTLHDTEILLPLAPAAADAAWDDRGVQVLGVLAEGVSVAAADAAVGALASSMYAEADGLPEGWSASATPLRTVLARTGASPMAALALVLLCLVVLMVSALNLASLLLARTTTRAREFGVRAAIGAGSAGVARASLMDGLLLSGAGGLLGLAVVVWARNIYVARFAAEIPSWASFPIDPRVLLATLAGTVLTALVVGLLPVLRAVAIGKENAITSSALGPSARSTSRGQNALLGVQIVLALVLVTASAGSLRTFSRVSDFDRLGYRWEGLTGVVVNPERGEGDMETSRVARELSRAAAEHPSLTAHATSRLLALSGADATRAGTTIRVGGRAEALAGPVPTGALAIGPGYLELNEIPILAGRSITALDGAGAPPAAVVSADAARSLWPDVPLEAVIGESVEFERDGVGTLFTVVGVAGAVILDPTAEGGRTSPRIYPSILQTPDALYGTGEVSVQLRASTDGTVPTVRDWTVWAGQVLPGAGVSQVFDMEEFLRQWVSPIRLTGSILGGLAMLVLCLVAIGIYGTVSYRIASTRHEIGIRLALGADARAVVRSVAGPLAFVVTAAIATGLLLTLVVTPVLAAGGFPVGRTDPATLLLVVVVVAGASAVASRGPLRRALDIDPSRSLREE